MVTLCFFAWPPRCAGPVILAAVAAAVAAREDDEDEDEDGNDVEYWRTKARRGWAQRRGGRRAHSSN